MAIACRVNGRAVSTGQQRQSIGILSGRNEIKEDRTERKGTWSVIKFTRLELPNECVPVGVQAGHCISCSSRKSISFYPGIGFSNDDW